MVFDSEKLIFSGLVINPVAPANRIFINDWRSRSPFDELAPACEAILCMDFEKNKVKRSAPAIGDVSVNRMV